ncbi:MAG TPA: ATP-binding cassette domain-containing protein [Pseudomonadales bacterium]|nr:ATP-binding cassette domain-containing protein [Pseudomonadales bacterium]
MPDAVVALNEVTKTFADVVAVDRLSLDVSAGTIYGILGPNGAGKTTTIRMLVGILRPDSGSLRVLDSDSPSAIKARLGYLPEEKGLYKKMRVLDLVAYFGRLKGLSRSDAYARGRRLLDEFELGRWHAAKCESLSKGMGQKVQIVATLVHEPELIVLDEPFSGLDPVNVELVRNIVLEQRARNRTVLLSTHVMEQAEQICDSLIVINRGRKLLNGTLADVRRSAHRTVTIDYDGDGACLKELPGIERLNDAGRHAELTLEPTADAQDILARLLGRLTIHRFDTREASLHEIFVRAVGSDRAA